MSNRASLVLAVVVVVAAYAVGDVVMTLAQYVAAVVSDGDYLNDWLTHVPRVVQPVVQGLGRVIAR